MSDFKMQSLDFDLAFHATTTTGSTRETSIQAYMVVARSPQGESATVMDSNLLSDAGELEKLIHSADDSIPTTGLRLASEDLGSKLFEAAFQGEVRDLFFLSYGRALGEKCPLRIRLRFSGAVSELAALSWEYLYWKERGRFLALSTETSIVRYLEIPDPAGSLKGELPLDMLMVLASPLDKTDLYLDEHRQAVERSLSRLERHKKLKLAVLQHANAEALAETLDNAAFDVIHIVAHGDFNAETNEGSLVLEHLLRESAPLPGHSLAILLEETTPRLVVIAACHGAVTSSRALFDGVAQQMIQQGVSTVIAMRSPVAIKDAERMASVFYSEMAQGSSIDTALTKARVRLQLDHPTSWGIPALFSRSAETRLFDLPKFFGHPFEQSLLRLEAALESDPVKGPSIVRETDLKKKRLGKAGTSLLDIQDNLQRAHDLGQKIAPRNAERQTRRFFELLESATDG